MTTDQDTEIETWNWTLHEDASGDITARPVVEMDDDQRHAWTQFHDRTATGGYGEVIDALRDLLAAFPWMTAWFGANGTKDESLDQLASVLEHYSEASASLHEMDWLSESSEAIAVDEYLDAAEAEAALQAELDWLADADPEAAEAIRRTVGLDGPREFLETIGDDHGVSRETVRQWKNRGFGKLALGQARAAEGRGDFDRAAELAVQARDLTRGSVHTKAQTLLTKIEARRRPATKGVTA